MPEALAELLYVCLLRLSLPLWMARLAWRGRREPGYLQAWRERLGWPRTGLDRQGGRLWIHAVSLGETRAAQALIEALRSLRPELRILLTHGTATGREAGRALLRPGDEQAWLPIDTPGAVDRFLRAHRPALGVLLETEIWPMLLRQAERAGVPMVLANARLSERSLRRGQKFASLMRPAARRVARVLAQTEADAGRIRSMGALRVEVCGNLKFDMQPAAEALALGKAWAAADARPIVLAASTREGEEAALLAAWEQGRDDGVLPARLWVVPRHPQRFDLVAEIIRKAGWSLSRRSEWGPGGPDARALGCDIWLGDSLGEMPAYYAAAQVALLGGSFKPLGGQNLIEAAACGCPVVMGPSTFNFKEAAEQAEAAGAAQRVPDLSQAVAAALALVGDAPRREAMAARARDFAGASRGAAVRQASALLDMLPKIPG